jgi:translation elongation factor EF-4
VSQSSPRGTLNLLDRNPVYLDKLQVEKQRGITVKAQAATMVYTYKGEKYMLNLIDTPVLNFFLFLPVKSFCSFGDASSWLCFF